MKSIDNIVEELIQEHRDQEPALAGTLMIWLAAKKSGCLTDFSQEMLMVNRRLRERQLAKLN